MRVGAKSGLIERNAKEESDRKGRQAGAKSRGLVIKKDINGATKQFEGEKQGVFSFGGTDAGGSW